jgi:hypothetical protein
MKLSVALQLEVPHRFIERFTSGRARSVEHPSAFGATKTPKTYFVDPYSPAGHPSFKVGLWHEPLFLWESYSCRSLEPSQSVAHISSLPALSAREMIHSAQYFERN